MRLRKGRTYFMVKYKGVYERYYVSKVISMHLKKDDVSWVYTSSPSATGEYLWASFHINFYVKFMDAMKCMGCKTIEQESDLPAGLSVDVDLKVKDMWVSKDYQIPAVNAMSNTSVPITLLSMGTGRGKTYCSLKAASNISKRLLLFVRPKYMDKWVDDVTKTYAIKPDNILYIKGSKDFKLALLEFKTTNYYDDTKVIILSNATYASYLKRYDDTGLVSSGVTPFEIMETMGVGTIIVDEADEHYHRAFTMGLCSSVLKIVYATATMKSSDPWIKKIHKLSFTPEQTYAENIATKHISIVPIAYSFRKIKEIRTKGYKGMYSHAALEKSVMGDPGKLVRYIKMVTDIMRMWARDRKEKDRMIVFAYTKEMCTQIVSATGLVLPKLSTKRFVAEDPYENMTDPDIRVTTVSSGGRAMDIEDLTAVLLSVSIDSLAANDQTSGRLRPLEKGRKTSFYYVYCNQIKTHIKYHENKKRTLAPKTKSVNQMTYPIAI